MRQVNFHHPSPPAPMSAVERPVPFTLRAGMQLMTSLRLTDPACTDLEAELQRQVARAPAMFRGAPIVLDLQSVAELAQLPDFDRLRAALLAESMVPVGVRNGSPEQRRAALAAGWALLPESRQEEPLALPEQSAPEQLRQGAKVVERPIRSGQQVYSGGDLVVLAPVSSGAEVLADGCIHVYGPLRGRALAGVQGDTSARIFCQALEAELLSVAGHYRVLEEIPAQLRGAPVQVRLAGEQLIIEPMPALGR